MSGPWESRPLSAALDIGGGRFAGGAADGLGLRRGRAFAAADVARVHVDAALEHGAIFEGHARRDDVAAYVARLGDDDLFTAGNIAGDFAFPGCSSGRTRRR